ncbi:MAG: neutral trehalase [Daejeonella sp.]|nr:neutral trehalase [Daejeonella sp.]
MRRRTPPLVSVLIFVLFSLKTYGQYQPEELGELFYKVQKDTIFSDSKTFTDCVPRYPLSTILKQYATQKSSATFNLKTFVQNNFRVPVSALAINKTDFPPIQTHIDNLWTTLIRKDSASVGSLIKLPYPYIVPGGRFNEMYYWDSYFTMLGLNISKKEELIQNMVDNFAFMIDTYGYVPNGNRTYCLSRSQPPFFSLMVELLAEVKGEQIYIKYLPQLLAEHKFWMSGSQKLSINNPTFKRVVYIDEHTVLNRYWDENDTPRPEAYREDMAIAESAHAKKEITFRNIRAAVESGWDFGGRWLKDGLSLNTIQTTEMIPVDLNSLLYHLESTISKTYSLTKNIPQQVTFKHKAELRKAAILTYCWDAKQGFFTDYQFTSKTQTGKLTLAGMFPLFFKIARDAQAEKAQKKIQEFFLYPGGLVTTPTLTHQQWDAPNGWAPMQWISYIGLKNYQYTDLANILRNRWVSCVNHEYAKSGKMMERYNMLFPEMEGGGGQYPSQDGYGWTNGVYLQMVNEQEKDKR